MTRPTPTGAFIAIVSAARGNVPFGQLNATDRAGLMRRADALGLDEAEAAAIIDARNRGDA